MMQGPSLPSGVRKASRAAATAFQRASSTLGSRPRADRFLKLRASVVTAWTVTSLLTLWIACPSSAGRERLGADVQLRAEPLLGMQILVRNDSGHIWEDVALTLDGRWTARRSTMRPDDRVVLSVTQFRQGDAAPPPDFTPRTLLITCAQGSRRFDLR